jgi:hypothetical protein
MYKHWFCWVAAFCFLAFVLPSWNLTACYVYLVEHCTFWASVIVLRRWEFIKRFQLCMFIACDWKLLKFVAEDTNSVAVFGSLKILSYNVWFRADLEMHRRMEALGELIQLHSPDVICLQVFLVPYSWNLISLCWLSS